jgi:hypothetical protein
MNEMRRVYFSRIFYLLALLCTASLDGDILVYEYLDISVDRDFRPVERTHRFRVDEDVVRRIAPCDVRTGAGCLPATQALTLAFEGYFKPLGVSENDFFEMAEATFLKIDDFTRLSEAAVRRKQSFGISHTRFYIVKCSSPFWRDKKLVPPGVLVLMDGTLVTARERE